MDNKEIHITSTSMGATWYDYWIDLPSGKKAYKEQGKDPVVEDIDELVGYLLHQTLLKQNELDRLKTELGKLQSKIDNKF